MNLVLLPMQWGDEGLDAVLELLAAEADVVLQFSAGCTAAGGARPATEDSSWPVSAAGVAVPWILGNTLALNLDSLFSDGPDLGPLLVASAADIVLPSYHADTVITARTLRAAGEGVSAHQVTSRELEERLACELSESDLEYCLKHRDALTKCLVNLPDYLLPVGEQNILYLGIAGALSDQVAGLPGDVSPAQASAAYACVAAGLGPTAIDATIGVTPVYSVAPSGIPMPWQPSGETGNGEAIRSALGVPEEDGRSYGDLDLVALRHGCRVNSVDGVVLTHLHALPAGKTLRCCVAYENDAAATVRFPSSVSLLSTYRSVTRAFGQLPETPFPESFDDVPSVLAEYVSFIEDFTETPVIGLSYGRNHLMLRRNPWTEY